MISANCSDLRACFSKMLLRPPPAVQAYVSGSEDGMPEPDDGSNAKQTQQNRAYSFLQACAICLFSACNPAELLPLLLVLLPYNFLFWTRTTRLVHHHVISFETLLPKKCFFLIRHP
jgi:hypothetical protein